MIMIGEDVRHTMGLDLGQARNNTAMAVLEQRWHAATAADFIASGTRGHSGEYRYRVVGAERLVLGTPYPKVVDWVKMRVDEYGESLRAVVVDATGVGSAVMDLLRRAQMGVRMVGVVITGSQAAVPAGSGGRTAAGYETVSRTELLTALQVAIQTKRLEIVMSKCREWEALTRELEGVRFEGKSPGVQDDLAFALGLAVWWGLR